MPRALGLDANLGLPLAALRDLAKEARDLGFASVWTPSFGYDPVQLCVAWHAASGLPTGISVLPLAYGTPATIAQAARTAHALTDGSFVLGLGSGRVDERPVAAVADALRVIRADAPGVPVYVGALGPQMVRFAGRHADGVALNWCTPEHVAWSRERLGRQVVVASYIRVAVDDDERGARRALGEQVVQYSVASPRYRAHWARMGYEAELRELEALRDRGVGDLADRVPERMLFATSYAGRAAGAREAVARLEAGLDVAIVRLLAARRGDVASVRAAMRATAPA
ncbi:MAG TPA: LLM class flavin-dependent oxidoreductase [Candidatus Limnocylindria bacterium]|nr:LLM class flavin-dependent oxidoreductase [Candidatus Limnocylindria bacterium]